MTKQAWEYAVLKVTFDGESIYLQTPSESISFEEVGNDGWELVAVQNVNGSPLAFFKRPTTPPMPTVEIGGGYFDAPVKTAL